MRPRRDRKRLADPNMRVTCTIRVSDYQWVIRHRYEFSALLGAAVASLRVKAGEPEPSILDQAPDEAVAEYIKEKGVALPPDDPRAWKSGELILYGVWHARQPPEVKGLPFETKQDRFRVEMAEAGPPA